mgnify:FL=1
MPGLDISVAEVITIMRNVTGRNDADDPQFTDTVMYNYLLNFIQNEHPDELRLFPDRTFYLR